MSPRCANTRALICTLIKHAVDIAAKFIFIIKNKFSIRELFQQAHLQKDTNPHRKPLKYFYYTF